MISRLIQSLLLVVFVPLYCFAADGQPQIMEKWSISPDQQKLAPISSPVNVLIDTVDGRIDNLTMELTNTQPPSLLTDKAIAAGQTSSWLKSVEIVIKPEEDFLLWLSAEEKAEKKKGGRRYWRRKKVVKNEASDIRTGAQPFNLEGDAKVYLEQDSVMVRSVMRMKLEVLPYKGGYGATINYAGERKVTPQTGAALLPNTESGSNPIFTIRRVNKDYEMTVKGRVDVRMSDYKKLYVGTWQKK